MKKILMILFAIVVIAVNIGCDQVSKEYARTHFKDKPDISIANHLFVITYAENNGGFLSVGSNIDKSIKPIIMIIVPVIVLALVLIFLFVAKNISTLELFLLCNIVGGGMSNIYDRIIHNGYVTDFLNVGIGNIRTGVFNIADMAILFGLIGLVIIQFTKKGTPN
ncbi:MAG: signal peptidase II [bacterium]